MRLRHSGMPSSEAVRRLREVRAYVLAMAATLSSDASDRHRACDPWMGPCAEGLNPPRWELGHIAWFQELWCLRRLPGCSPLASPLLKQVTPSRLDCSDWLYDSSRIPHAARWQAPLPSVAHTLAYAAAVLDALAGRLAGSWPDDDPDLPYYVELSLYHEAMHLEAWWMMWQRLGMPPPSVLAIPYIPDMPVGPQTRPVVVPAGEVELGARARAGFVFDNEEEGVVQSLPAFEIDAIPVRFIDFAAFVDAGGYADLQWWSPAGQHWLLATGTTHPVYWRRVEGHWQVRVFSDWVELPVDQAMRHVTAFEAEAYARWRGRRLPHATEWQRAHALGALRLGRVWEWTATDFRPYPGFVPGPYADYSLPWFGDHRELRGAGSAVTDAALARADFRNFYLPHRGDVFAGFRTVAA